MTALLLAFGLAGLPEVAADIALVQSATLALFYAFSANARNVILSDPSGLASARLLRSRLLLFGPLAVMAYYLSVELASVASTLAIVLITRRICEWIGEIGLARHELMGRSAFALATSVVEFVTLSLCIIGPILWGWSFTVSAIPWVFAPLLATYGSKLRVDAERGDFSFRCLVPHFGSTAVIGTSAYVFRISISLLVGKSVAGELFTAFAIGGLVPTIYGQAVAPTLVQRLPLGLPKLLLAVPAAIFLVSVGVSLLILWRPDGANAFWLATNLSIAGGALMTVAATLRTQLIQKTQTGENVFGPDLLANVLIFTSVPFMFYVIGPKSLVALYFFSGCLSLFFFSGMALKKDFSRYYNAFLLIIIPILLLTPVFFTLSAGLFNERAFVYEAGGNILRLPLPISIAGLFAGIALLANYAHSIKTLVVVFFTALLFVVASFVAAQGNALYEKAKLVLLAQFVLPMFSLILGEMYGVATRKPIFARVTLVILLLVIPLQLAATWYGKHTLLSPHIFVFSIYQHLQYFPMVVVALTFIATASLWDNSENHKAKVIVNILVTAVGVYLVASQSLLAIAAYPVGLVIIKYLITKQNRLSIRTYKSIVITLFAMLTYGILAQPEALGPPRESGQFLGDKLGLSPLNQGEAIGVGGASQRFDHWRFYATGLIKSVRSFVFGQASPPDRNLHPSAHNYLLDVLYNFGLLALLPLLLLMCWTFMSIWKWRSSIMASPSTIGLVVATVYLLLGENMLKVGMRQPYPGIVTFFIWGLLIARLGALSSQKNSASTLP